MVQDCPRPRGRIVPCTFRVPRRRLESLASFRFPKPLHKRALTQALQSAVEMMPRISEGLVELPADLPQIQSLKIKQLKRDALAFRQFVKGLLQLDSVQLRTDLAVQVRLSQQCIAKLARVCTNVKSPACQMSSTVQGPVQGNLKHPILYRAFRPIVKKALLE